MMMISFPPANANAIRDRPDGGEFQDEPVLHYPHLSIRNLSRGLPFFWLFGGAGRDGVGAGLVGALGGRHRVGVGIGSRNRKGMSEWLRLEVGGWRRCSLKTKSD